MPLLFTAPVPMCSPFVSGLLSGTIAGVLVSILSQFLLQGVFDPAQQLKGKIVEVGIRLDLLIVQRSFFDENYGIMRDDIDLIGRLSAEIHSLSYRILMYSRGHLEKRQGKGSRRKSCYRDRRVERAWNAHVPHRAAASTSSDTGQSLDHPPRRTTALWLRQRPGRSCSNYHPAI